jgi:DNA-binding response OmpR family regulator
MNLSISPTAMLLEDEGLIALDLGYALENAGFTVTTLASTRAAEEWLKQNSPDLAIIDILLQDGPSHRVAELLFERNIPFLVHSGDLAHMHQDTPLAKGEWISKPAKSTAVADWAWQAVQSKGYGQ